MSDKHSFPIPSAEDRLRFVKDVQVLLDEGVFTSTYKFALLSALTDLAIESGDVGGEPLTLTVEKVAEKFVEYYWRQVIPFTPANGSPITLLHNNGRQVEIAGSIQRAHRQFGGSLSAVRSSYPEWRKLVRKVRAIVTRMPLWKLQTVRDCEREFLYANQGQNVTIQLKPGIAYCFREFHGTVRNLVQGAWVRWIRSQKKNAVALGHTEELYEFLFGCEWRRVL